MQYAIAFICGSALFYIYRFFPVTSLLLSVLLLGLSTFKKPRAVTQNFREIHYSVRRRLLSVLAVIIMALFGFCSAYLRTVPLDPVSAIAGQIIVVKGTVRSGPVPMHSRTGSFSHIIDISEAADDRGDHLSLREMRVMSDSVMTAGKAYLITVQIPPDAYFMNPGSKPLLAGFALGIVLVDNSSGQVWARPAKFFGTLRARLNEAFKNSLSPGSAPFIMALITGERGLLTKETNDAFTVTGLSHILHKAGLHFGLLLFFFFGVTCFFIKALPHRVFSRLTIYASPSQIAALVCLPFMICYLGISPPDFGTLRAFIMICFFLFGLLFQRKGFWLNSLMAAVFIIVLYQPDSLLNLSFQLSFLSVLCIGIAVGGKHVRDANHENGPVVRSASAFSRLRSSLMSYSRSSMLITLAANAGTAPLIINYFHMFSIISPMSNLIVIPVVGFIILPLAFLSSFFYLFFNFLPLRTLLDALTRHLLSCVYHVAKWEFMAVKVPAFPPILLICFYAGLAIYTALVYSGNKSRAEAVRLPFRILLFPCVIAIAPIIIFSVMSSAGKSRLSVTFLDVGQGDGAVIELPDHRTMIIDTGKSGFQIGEFLRYRGVDEIEALVLSHPDNDHVGGSGYLLNNFKVHMVWDNSRMDYKDGFLGQAGHRGLQRGDTLHGKGYTIMALHPYDGFYSGSGKKFDENNDSLLLRVQGATASFLFTGDLEKEGEEDAVHIAPYLKSTVLKVAHHGSRSSSSEVFLNAVSPEIAVISVGRKNSYGHPHPETLYALSSCRVLRTDINGAVEIREGDGGKLQVKTWRDFRITEVSGVWDEWMNINRLFWVW